ncbi:MAG TPA: hypothetical protein DHU56_13570 [Marinobacter sp.]|nr:hypothetical protein [Marinobacter sp.]
MRASTSLLCSLLMVTIVVLLLGCDGEPDKYDFGLSVAGGPASWPVKVQKITFDNSWRAPGGIFGRGFNDSPPAGAMVVLSPKPIPSSMEARWFSYRTQTFHHVDLKLPEDFQDRVEGWYEEYTDPKYRHYLIVGFSGKGDALVWWRARCMDCGYDRSQDFSTPIVENVKAMDVEGDPGRYRSQTEQFIDEGLFPAPPGFED